MATRAGSLSTTILNKATLAALFMIVTPRRQEPPVIARPRARAVTLAVTALAVPFVASACGSQDGTADSDGAERPVMSVAFFPLADAASTIAGDTVEVINLTPPGVGPHDLELTPRAREDIERSDAVAFLGAGFQPQIEDVVDGLPDDVTTVDLLGVVDLLPVTDPLAGIQGEVDGEVLEGGLDPHAWVSPRLFGDMVAELTDVLVELSPDSRTDMEAARDGLLEELDALDEEFAAGLAGCESTALVTSHRAFEYLARDYGLTQIPIGGITPEEEPDPRTLEAIAAAAREEDVTTVFFEDVLPPDLAETVAEEIGAEVDLLSPIETIEQAAIDEGATYLSIQEDNLAALTEGLRCTG
jgi:zinc transport system substrate-binding protein